MLARFKQYLIIAVFVGAFYFLLSHHIIFMDFKQFDLLKKQTLSLEYTFFSLKQVTPLEALRIDKLREDGLGELLVENGTISEEELTAILKKIDHE